MRRPSPLMTPRTASTTCAGQIYNRAIALKQEGDYQTATDLFMLLGDYLSSADQAVESRPTCGTPSMTRPTRWRAAAICQGAYDLFSSLSGYRDAAQRAENLAAQLGIQ